MDILIAIIQTAGVFLASTYGLSTIMNMWKFKTFESMHIILFGMGMAMAMCGIFFK